MTAAESEEKYIGVTYEFADRILEILQKKGDWISRNDLAKEIRDQEGLSQSTTHTYLSKAISYLKSRGCIQKKFDHGLHLKALILTIDDAISQDVGETTPAETAPDEHIKPECVNHQRIAPAPDANKMRVVPANFPEALIKAMDAGVRDQLWECRAALMREAVREYLFKFGYIKQVKK